MFIILIETSGNQRYIFSTNKLRENVGASELTYQIGTKAVLEAIGETYTNAQNLQEFLLDEKRNSPIEKQSDNGVEVIIATSGKALLLTKTRKKAKEIVGKVTRNALENMPGLTVHGAIVKVEEDLTDIHHAVGKVHHRLEEIRHQIPSNLQRFQRLPFVEPCATSGLPANEIYQHISLKNKPLELKPHSMMSIEKQEASNQGRDRLENAIQSVKPNVKLMGNINELEKKFQDTRWLSIIHADGNGLGEIFLNFKNHSKSSNGRDYIINYRMFSIALDICTINAAGIAIENFQNSYRKDYKERTGNDTIELPFIPLILGGDDLTVISDGEYAIKFTHNFLTEFENQTVRTDIQGGIIPTIAKEAFGVSRLGICAGIAIIKPHYPFHQAYDLAENLIKSAKLVKTKIQHEHNGKKDVSLPCSAMDFHVLYDSSGVELKQIRKKLEISEKDDSETYLYAKPYIVSKPSDLEKSKPNVWLENRTWDKLETRVCAMKAPEKDDEGKRKLPNSQLHHIRESLFRGQKETDSEVNLFKNRYKDKDFGKLLCEKPVKNESGKDTKEYSLFFDEKHKKDGREIDGHTTHFLDALDVVELWKGFSEERCQEILKKKFDETEAQDEQ